MSEKLKDEIQLEILIKKQLAEPGKLKKVVNY